MAITKKKTEALPRLAPYLVKIRECVANAEKEYKSLDASVRRVHSPRTRSSNISDYIRDFVYKNLIVDPNIRASNRYGSIRLLIEDQFQLTFKKLDRNLRPSYIPTSRQGDFYSQLNHQLEFDNMPEEVTNVIAGYQWQPLDGSRIYLVCPDGIDILWFIELIEPAKEAVKETIVEGKKSSTQSQKRVFPKRKTIKEEQPKQIL